jgi:hypothetical protein
MKRTVYFFGLMLVSMLMLCACGKVHEQNEIVLKLSSLGNREATVANKAAGEKNKVPPEKSTETNVDNAEGYQAELLTAFREYTFFPTPGVRFLSFPKGNQVYSFTSGKSIESPNDEGFKLNAMDGKVSFDGTVQMHVDENLPDIKERLLKFVKTFSLTQYAGSDNVLTDFMSSRFKPILYAGFQNYVSGKRVLEVVRGKKDINDHMAKYMNEKFNEYGLTFTMVAITSAMSFDTEQQERMNRIIIKEAESSAMKIRNEKVLPLTKEIAKLELDGKDEEAKLMYEANSQSITTIANAWKTRRDLIIAQIGKDNYFRFEQSKLMVNALMEKKTSVKLVPSGANLFIGNNLPAISALKEVGVSK